MKFLHTSDWHIGRQLHNQSLIEDQAFVLDQIVDLAIENEVDAVVVAGDIYDRAIPPVQAVELLDHILHRLVIELSIPVLMIAGNHDSHARLGFAASHMSDNGLYIQGPLTESIEPIIINGKGGNSAAFFLIPYIEPIALKTCFNVKRSPMILNHMKMQCRLFYRASPHVMLVIFLRWWYHIVLLMVEKSQSQKGR